MTAGFAIVEASSNTEDEARAEFKRAASLTRNARERELLLARVTSKALEPGTGNLEPAVRNQEPRNQKPAVRNQES